MGRQKASPRPFVDRVRSYSQKARSLAVRGIEVGKVSPASPGARDDELCRRHRTPGERKRLYLRLGSAMSSAGNTNGVESISEGMHGE